MCKQGTETRITRCLFPKPGCKGGEKNGSNHPQGSYRSAGEGNTPGLHLPLLSQVTVEGSRPDTGTTDQCSSAYLMFSNLKNGELPLERDGGGKETRLDTGMPCSQTCPLLLRRFLFTRAGLTFSCGSLDSNVSAPLHTCPDALSCLCSPGIHVLIPNLQ